MMMKFINLAFFFIMIIMNYLANALPINGKTTGELSDSYPNLFVPAGITFSIWGVIYLLLAIFCVLQFFKSQSLVVNEITWLFAFSSLLNGLWIVAWHYQKLWLSLLIMIGLLVTLILINTRIKELPLSISKAAFGIYLGWICIATIANVTALLVHIDWGGFGISEQSWSIALIVTGLLITSFSMLQLKNPFIGLAVAWAFLGIAFKRSTDNQAIYLVAIAAMFVSILVLGLVFFKKNTMLA